MRIHVLQHSELTPPGSVLDWLQLKNHRYSVVRVDKDEPLPALSETDWIIILGGKMNVDQLQEYPWLAREKLFLKEAVDAHKTCLGICLGGQLLAQTLGAEVRPNDHWETGWHPVQLGVHLDQDLRLTAFHWHEDTFSLPNGAIRIATNLITENQGFMFGDHIVGLQFHPEAKEEWIKQCAESDPYPSGPYTQNPEDVLKGTIFLHPMRKWFFELLNKMEFLTQARLNRNF
jgi:GMP synthase-like glutamine amidotransferase